MASAPLNRMPYSAPLPVPATMALGVASPRAQGQDMTSTVTETSKAKPKEPTRFREYGVSIMRLSGVNQSEKPMKNQNRNVIRERI